MQDFQRVNYIDALRYEDVDTRLSECTRILIKEKRKDLTDDERIELGRMRFQAMREIMGLPLKGTNNGFTAEAEYHNWSETMKAMK